MHRSSIRWGLVLLALAGLVYLAAAILWRTPESDTLDPAGSGESARDATLRPALLDEPVRSASPAPAPAPLALLPDDLRFLRSDLAGETAFQRRLSTGDYLLRLEAALAKERVTAAQVESILEQVRLYGLLYLDEVRLVESELHREVAPADRPGALLERLTVPGRDPGALRLNVSRTSESPVGEGALLRVWTRDAAYPLGEIDAGEILLRRLIALGGDTSAGGYDVLATARMGRDVFPDARVYRFMPRAAGFFTWRDEVCCIRTTFGTAKRKRLLRHELLHAWLGAPSPQWSSRFIEEGLAEYVSFNQETDLGLTVPPGRLRHQFAALLVILDRLQSYGTSVGGASFARLARASPAEFYAMGHFGYLLAQACVTFAGGDAVEAAIRSRSEQPLLEIVDRLTWPELLGFVQEHARGGDATRAAVFEDLTGGERLYSAARSRWRALHQPGILRTLGFTIPPWASAALLRANLEIPADLSAQSRARLEEVLGVLSEAEHVAVVTEATRALAAPCRVADPELLPDYGRGVITRLDLVAAVREKLTGDDGDAPPPVAAWRGSVRPAPFPPPLTDEGIAVRGLFAWLTAKSAERPVLVLFVASRSRRHADLEVEVLTRMDVDRVEVAQGMVLRALTIAYRDEFFVAGVDLAAALVVDLADGKSEAKAIADALSSHLGRHARVAYWNPQQPLR